MDKQIQAQPQPQVQDAPKTPVQEARKELAVRLRTGIKAGMCCW
jgi:hypothetical protein